MSKKHLTFVFKGQNYGTAQHSTALAQLIAKLKEIFQINQPDLDFGIYRILNSRSAEIQQFLEKRYLTKSARQ
ncbi:hypothetical protein CVP04_04005 [Caviibacterium pharyngocola]|uniref:Uncharacterized protein n=1 Tax=Caviibacterium pharyngocola TaxID=28159 RepID=A0A2M8RWN4_9PAST|nr:hypothetical protein CVP04_04005 [Caviibacterium pharyngocola]